MARQFLWSFGFALLLSFRVFSQGQSPDACFEEKPLEEVQSLLEDQAPPTAREEFAQKEFDESFIEDQLEQIDQLFNEELIPSSAQWDDLKPDELVKELNSLWNNLEPLERVRKLNSFLVVFEDIDASYGMILASEIYEAASREEFQEFYRETFRNHFQAKADIISEYLEISTEEAFLKGFPERVEERLSQAKEDGVLVRSIRDDLLAIKNQMLLKDFFQWAKENRDYTWEDLEERGYVKALSHEQVEQWIRMKYLVPPLADLNQLALEYGESVRLEGEEPMFKAARLDMGRGVMEQGSGGLSPEEQEKREYYYDEYLPMIHSRRDQLFDKIEEVKKRFPELDLIESDFAEFYFEQRSRQKRAHLLLKRMRIEEFSWDKLRDLGIMEALAAGQDVSEQELKEEVALFMTEAHAQPLSEQLFEMATSQAERDFGSGNILEDFNIRSRLEQLQEFDEEFPEMINMASITKEVERRYRQAGQRAKITSWVEKQTKSDRPLRRIIANIPEDYLSIMPKEHLEAMIVQKRLEPDLKELMESSGDLAPYVLLFDGVMDPQWSEDQAEQFIRENLDLLNERLSQLVVDPEFALVGLSRIRQHFRAESSPLDLDSDLEPEANFRELFASWKIYQNLTDQQEEKFAKISRTARRYPNALNAEAIEEIYSRRLQSAQVNHWLEENFSRSWRQVKEILERFEISEEQQLVLRDQYVMSHFRQSLEELLPLVQNDVYLENLPHYEIEAPVIVEKIHELIGVEYKEGMDVAKARNELTERRRELMNRIHELAEIDDAYAHLPDDAREVIHNVRTKTREERDIEVEEKIRQAEIDNIEKGFWRSAGSRVGSWAMNVGEAMHLTMGAGGVVLEEIASGISGNHYNFGSDYFLWTQDHAERNFGGSVLGSLEDFGESNLFGSMLSSNPLIQGGTIFSPAIDITFEDLPWQAYRQMAGMDGEEFLRFQNESSTYQAINTAKQTAEFGAGIALIATTGNPAQLMNAGKRTLRFSRRHGGQKLRRLSARAYRNQRGQYWVGAATTAGVAVPTMAVMTGLSVGGLETYQAYEEGRSISAGNMTKHFFEGVRTSTLYMAMMSRLGRSAAVAKYGPGFPKTAAEMRQIQRNPQALAKLDKAMRHGQRLTTVLNVAEATSGLPDILDLWDHSSGMAQAGAVASMFAAYGIDATNVNIVNAASRAFQVYENRQARRQAQQELSESNVDPGKIINQVIVSQANGTPISRTIYADPERIEVAQKFLEILNTELARPSQGKGDSSQTEQLEEVGAR